MKIDRCRDLVPDGAGSIKIHPEEPDDLWVVYNMIAEGDTVLAVTTRKVLKEAGRGGRRNALQVKLRLEIKVEATEYDKEGSVLRVRGKNIVENEYVKIGAFHTLEINLGRPFVLSKDVWDQPALETLRQASEPSSASADLAVVLMQDGLANILLVGNTMTHTLSRIETPIARKQGHDKALSSFFDRVLQALLKDIDFKIVRCVVIASPGFTKDQFHRQLMLQAERKKIREIIENKSRIILVHSTSGHKHCLKEVLDSPEVMNLIKDTKAAKEVRALKGFFSMLSKDPNRACYGPKHVEFAHERMAIETVLITDELFGSSDVPTRKKYVNLVKEVKELGGTAYIFSSMHVSGEELAQLTGVAAVLRFPLPDLEELEM